MQADGLSKVMTQSTKLPSRSTFHRENSAPSLNVALQRLKKSLFETPQGCSVRGITGPVASPTPRVGTFGDPISVIVAR